MIDDPFELAAHEMADMLHSDSDIPPSESYPIILTALRADGRVPTLYEMECLVMGGPLLAEVDDSHPDMEGEGNPEVDALFPMTARSIAGFF